MMTYSKPVKTRVLCLLLSLVMILSFFGDWSFPTEAYEDHGIEVTLKAAGATEAVPLSDYPGSYFRFSDLKRKNGTRAEDIDQLIDGEVLVFNLEWGTGNFSTPTTDSDSTFILTVDHLLTKHANIALAIDWIEGNGCDAALDLDPTTGRMTIAVSPNGDYENFRGSFEVELEVNIDENDLDGDKVIFKPLFTDLQFDYALNRPELTAYKSVSGSLYEEDGKYYQDFSLTLNTANGAVTDVALSDTFGDLYKSAPATLQDSEGNTYTTVPGDHSFTLTIPEVSGYKVLNYSLEVDITKLPEALRNQAANDQTMKTNTLNATYNNGIEDDVAVPQTSAYPDNWQYPTPNVEKTGVLDKVNGEIKWTITFKPGVLGIGNDISDLSVTDTLSFTQIAGTDAPIDVLKNAFGSSGYTVTPDGSSIVLDPSLFTPAGDNYVLNYFTQVDDEYLDSWDTTNFTNKVKASYKGYEPEATVSVPVGKTGDLGATSKSVVNADPASLAITWEISVEVPDPDVEAVSKILINDNSASGDHSSYTSTLLKGPVTGDSFTYKIDGEVTDILSYMSEIYYLESAQYYSPRSDTFDSSKKYSGFEFSLDSDFISRYRNKTLTVTYTAVMGGDMVNTDAEAAYQTYKNNVTTTYYIGTTPADSDSATAEYKPVLSAKKLAYNGSSAGIYDDYGSSDDYPLLAFWEIRLKSDDDFTVDQTIRITDTVSAGNSYFDNSVRLVTGGESYDNNYGHTYVKNISSEKIFTDYVTVRRAGTDTVEFSFTFDQDLIDAAKANNNSLNIVYATAADDKTARKVYFGETAKVTNTADVYSNEVMQAKDIHSSQDLSAPDGVLSKYQEIKPDGGNTRLGNVSYTLTVNEPAADLSSGDTIIVDDWLGGNLSIPDHGIVTVTRYYYDTNGDLAPDPRYTPDVYEVVDNPDYNSTDGTIRSFMVDVETGVRSDTCAVYKTGVGRKMTFTLPDNACFKITYDINYEKANSSFETVEEQARYINVAVIRNDEGDSTSKSTSISYGNYHIAGALDAGAVNNSIIFDIKKKWDGDYSGKGRPDSIRLLVTKTNLTDATQTPITEEVIIKVNDNAVELEDGTWLFALKLPALTTVGTVITRYSYTIDEAEMDGYAASWSNPFTDVQLPENSTSSVVSSVLTNTASTRFSVRKADITGVNEISGASLAIYKASDFDDATGKPRAGATAVDSWISDGSEHISAPAAGDYVLVETGTTFYDSKTDKNYDVTTSAVHFTVTSTGVTNVTGQNSGVVSDSDRENGYITYTAATGSKPAEFVVCDAESAEVTAKLSVNKFGSSGSGALFGALIEVYNAADIGTDGKPNAGASPVQSWTTAGETHTVGFTDGSYVLVESGTTFTDSATGTKYKVTDSTFPFTVYGGRISVSRSWSAFDMSYESGTLNIYDEEVEKVKIRKTDATGGEELAGAVLQLFDSLGNQIGYDYTSTTSSVWEVGPLEKGTYTIKETVAPDRYTCITTDVEFDVDEYGAVTEVRGSGELSRGIVLVEDTLSQITISKKDGDGKGIDDYSSAAVFEITAPSGMTLQGVKFDHVKIDPEHYGSVTISDGTTSKTFSGHNVTIIGLRDGTYTLTEVTPPEGYYSIGTATFTVENGVIVSADDSAITNGGISASGSGIVVWDKSVGNIDIEVIKIWDGVWDESTTQIDKIDVSLYSVSDPNTPIETITLDDREDWYGIFSVQENSGEYFIKETYTDVDGYTVETTYEVNGTAGTAGSEQSQEFGSDDGDVKIEITNRVEEEVTYDASVSVTKLWKDADGNAVTGEDIPERPVTVELYKSGDTASTATAVLNSDNNWTKKFEGLANGGKYYVKEVTTGDFTTVYSPAGLVSGQSGEVTATNDAADPVTIEITNTVSTVEIHVTKVWTGATVNIGSVKVTLYKEGSTAAEGQITLTKAGGWNGSFAVQKNSGTYYVVEEAVTEDGYIITTKYAVGAGTETTEKSADISSASDSTVTITNNAEREISNNATLAVIKKWQDNRGNPLDGSLLPTSVSVALYKSGDSDPTATAVLSADNRWQYTFTGLTEGVEYYVKEADSGDFAVTYSPADAATDTQSGLVAATTGAHTSADFTVTNTLGDVTINVSKVWSGAWDNTTSPITSITAKLYKNGTADSVATAVLTQADGWTGSFKVLKNSGTYYVVEEAVTEAGYTITTKYAVGTGTETTEKSADISSASDSTVTITNNAERQFSNEATLRVVKQWKDNRDNTVTDNTMLPPSVTVQLYKADGTAVGSPVTLSSANEWKYTFTGLTEETQYYVKETGSGDFTVTYSPADASIGTQSGLAAATTSVPASPEFTITNTLGDVTINVSKEWSGNWSNATAQIGSITASLYKTGTSDMFVDSVVLTAPDWSGSFTVIKNSGTYYVKEDTVTLTGYTISAKYTVTIDGTEGRLTEDSSDTFTGAKDASVKITNDVAANVVIIPEITLTKADSEGHPIPAGNNAKFTLAINDTGKDLEGVKIGGTTIDAGITSTDFEGNAVVFTGLKDGSYTLTETEAPDGFCIGGPFGFTVEGGVVIAASGSGSTGLISGSGSSILIRDRESDITVSKIDIGGTPIPADNKAKFTLRITETGKTLEGVKIGDTTIGNVTEYAFDGNTAEFKGLKDGSYTLEETTAPDGYLTISTFSFTIENGVITTGSTVTNGEVDYSQGDKIIVKDKAKNKITISKTDMTGNEELEGAVLQLFDENGDQIGDDYTSSTTDKWEVGPLDEGTYTVKEITAPDGYGLIETDVTFTVDSEGKVTGVTGSGTRKDESTVLVNDDLSTITISKTDIGGTAIPDTNKATFKLTITETGKTLEGVKIGDTTLGNVTEYVFEGNTAEFTGLKDGSYTLEETTAPDGYLTISTFSFTIENGVITTGSTVTNGEVDYSQGDKIIVKDNVKPTVPETPEETTVPVKPYVPYIVTSTENITTAPETTPASEDTTAPAETTVEDTTDASDITESEETPDEVIEIDSDDDTTAETTDTDITNPTPGETGIVTDSTEENPHTGNKALACAAMLIPEVVVIVAARKRKKDSDKDE